MSEALARFEALKGDAGFPRVVFQRLTADEPETLKAIAQSLQIPRGLFVEWFSTEHAALYDSALKVRAGEFGEEAVGIADEATPETVAVKKLQAETRLKVASKWDRNRYGDAEVQRGPMVVIQVAQLRAPADALVTIPSKDVALLPVEPAEAAL